MDPVPQTSPEIDPGAQLKRLLASARRNRLRIVVYGLFGLVLGGFVAALVPDVYTSRTLLQVRQRELIDDSRLLRAINEKPLIQKEETLEKELLSFQWIHDVLRDLAWPDVWGRIKDDPARVYELIHKIQEDGNFEVSMSTDTSGDLLVELSFTWDDPRKAYEFVLRARRNWIQRRDEEYRRDYEMQLEAAERVVSDRRKAFEAARLALEKWETENRITSLSDENADIQLNKMLTLAFSEARAELESVRPQIEELEKQLAVTPRTVEISTKVPNVEYEARANAVQQARAQLADLLQNQLLTEKHPNVKDQKKKVEAAEKALAEVKDNAIGAASVQEQVNEAWLALRKRLDELRPLEKGLLRKLEDLGRQIEEVESRLSRLPVLLSTRQSMANTVEQRQRDLNEAQSAIVPLRDKVDLMTRRNAVALGHAERALEQAGAFAILEEPVVPRKPAGIPKPLFALIGLIVGVAIGLAQALVGEMTRSTFTTPNEVADVLRLPVLGAVGRIVTPREARRERLRGALHATGTVLVLAALVGAVWMVTVEPDRLPPSMQKALDDVRANFK